MRRRVIKQVWKKGKMRLLRIGYVENERDSKRVDLCYTRSNAAITRYEDKYRN